MAGLGGGEWGRDEVARGDELWPVRRGESELRLGREGKEERRVGKGKQGLMTRGSRGGVLVLFFDSSRGSRGRGVGWV